MLKPHNCQHSQIFPISNDKNCHKIQKLEHYRNRFSIFDGFFPLHNNKMLYIGFFFFIIFCSASSLTSESNPNLVSRNVQDALGPVGSSINNPNSSGSTNLEAIVGSLGIRGLLLPAPPHVIKINKESTEKERSQISSPVPQLSTEQSLVKPTPPKTATTAETNTQKSSTPHSVTNPTPSTPKTTPSKTTTTPPATPASFTSPAPSASSSTPISTALNIVTAPLQIASSIVTKGTISSIAGSWTFSVINTLKQVNTIPVQITNSQIIFTYCNDIVLNYKITKSEIALSLGSELTKSCPNMSPTQSKVLSSMTNVDSFSLNGNKLYLASAGVNKAAFIKV